MIPRNLSEQMLHDLGAQIVQGTLQPGELLPKVETLSEMKNVSRTVIREALKGLSARRLIEASTRKGTVVRERKDWLWWDPDVIAWASTAEKNRTFLLQLSEVRLAIEPAAVRLAAKNATEKDLQEIKKRFKELEAATQDEDAWVEADFAFHDSILEASHNELMVSLVQTLYSGLVQSRHTTIKVLMEEQKKDQTTMNEALEMHKFVMEAICSGDEEAAYQNMSNLLYSVVAVIEKNNKESG
ncbi:FadR/GntR family transcriptional regulator [Alkalicoccus daliensis]|uniref:DNA-binding transcriptional regulator, FadR family n=1 Tax=Alkalicoccus daliensis TaxID=745820 RepID=A0A1H0F567_9BACI|nr:FadR/GntR family transcriptional regulator [Alkalicoccus daliensis]SDN89726.1 DNA-binding transcriptional regulator, FadR family [Alkalicoccus daliensis]